MHKCQIVLHFLFTLAYQIFVLLLIYLRWRSVHFNLLFEYYNKFKYIQVIQTHHTNVKILVNQEEKELTVFRE